MAIIRNLSSTPNVTEASLVNYPYDFVTDKVKQSDAWQKTVMDYFSNIGLREYRRKTKKYIPNYELLNNILKKYHFTNDENVCNFLEDRGEDFLPEHVRHHSIISAPVNEMLGEMTRRPDTAFVRAMDSESQTQKKQYRQDLLQEFFNQQIQMQNQMILSKQDLSDEEYEQANEQLTVEKLQQLSAIYSTTAEKWGALQLEALKVNLSLKEKSEEGFRDYLITAGEFWHIYEDNSPLGLNVEIVNPVNVWHLSTANEKYLSDPLDPSAGAYAAGISEMMEISEIIHKFKLEEKEIKHLYSLTKEYDGIPYQESNFFTGKKGENSIDYNTYDRLSMQERILNESSLSGDGEMDDFLGVRDNLSTYGNRMLVTRAYWCSKKKVGKLTIVNEDNIPEVMYVDENYKDWEHPMQLGSVEWNWDNQWYYGLRIGPDIYYVKPFELLAYCPILGVYNCKNTPATSFVDMSKPFQMLYNIYFTKAFEQMQKDSGMVELWNTRTIPSQKDGDPADDIENFENIIAERGKAYIDDSPENLKGASQFNQYSVLNASRAPDITAYYNIARNIKLEYQELVGFSPQRLAKVQATETATATNAALSQSYAQTEPYFAQHEYLLNKVYQAILDAAQYVTISKPTSTISNINGEGEEAFMTVNSTDISMADLKVFVTNRGEDSQAIKSLQQLSQSLIQNGISAYELSQIYFSKSARKIQDVLKVAAEKTTAIQQQEQNIQQQQLSQQQEQFQQQTQMAMQQHAQDQQFEAWQKELDRLSKERIAIISATGYGQTPAEDADGDGVADALEMSRLQIEQQSAMSDRNIKLREIQAKETEIQGKMQIEKDKIERDYANMKNDEKIASMQTKAKAASKPKKK